MKSAKENYLNKSSLVNFQNSLTLRENYVKYLQSIVIGIVIGDSIAIGIVYSYIFSFIRICYEIKSL